MKERKKKKTISAKEFDEKFDRGEDVMEYMDLSTIKINHPVQRINVDVPRAMLQRVDKEAARIGVPRTSLIKMWIAEHIRQLTESNMAGPVA